MPNSTENRAAANSSSALPAPKFYGISLRLSVVLFLTAILLSVLISIGDQSVGTAVVITNIVAALAVTTITHPRNLYIVVTSIPITIIVSLLGAGWVTTRSTGGSGGIAQIATAIYPITQYFPQLLLTFLGCISIALIRLYLLRRQKQRQAKALAKQRAQQQAQQARNQEVTTKSRRQATNAAHQLSVQELLERRKQREGSTRSRQRSAVERTAQRGPNGEYIPQRSLSGEYAQQRSTASEYYTQRSERSQQQDGGARTYAQRPAPSATPRPQPNYTSSSSQRPAQSAPYYSQANSRLPRTASESQGQMYPQRTSSYDRANPTRGQIPRPKRYPDTMRRESDYSQQRSYDYPQQRESE